jgi:Zn-finger nucleic acid-binding protein
MDCLRCQSKMIQKEAARGDNPADYQQCPSCGSIWCDGKNLSTLTGRHDVYARSSIQNASNKTSLACPSCEGNLLEIKLTGEKISVLVDYCDDCSGTWFDSGELQKVSDIKDDPDDVMGGIGFPVFQSILEMFIWI